MQPGVPLQMVRNLQGIQEFGRSYPVNLILVAADAHFELTFLCNVLRFIKVLISSCIRL